MITVITPTHNRPESLRRAMDSVLSQTEKDFEYIVIDDNPEDEKAKEVVDSFHDERVRYLRNTEPNPAKTHCLPLNLALQEARGDYIAYLDDDNEFYPYHLEILKNTLDKGYDLAYCDMVVEDEMGNLSPGIALDFDSQFLMHRNFIDTSEIMHRKELAFHIGGWDLKAKRFTDWNFCARATKWGARIKRVPIVALKYHVSREDTQSVRAPVKSWYDPQLGLTMFEPTFFDPVGDFIFCPYLGENPQEENPRVAIFTLTYERLELTKEMWRSLQASTKVPFDWFVFDQGSKDGTAEWLKKQNVRYLKLSDENVGITKGSNALLDAMGDDYQIIIKVDNDAQFLTEGWLESFIDLWKRNHMVYCSPYPEGLVDNPGGAPRVGYGRIAGHFLEVTEHIGGLCAFVDAKAYKGFRWGDRFLHGMQDTEASRAFRAKGYMPCYVPAHRVMHQRTTAGQKKDFPEYFSRREKEKTTVCL